MSSCTDDELLFISVTFIITTRRLSGFAGLSVLDMDVTALPETVWSYSVVIVVPPAPPYITHYPSWLASMLRLLRRVSALLFLCPGKAQNSTGKKEVYEDYADCY